MRITIFILSLLVTQVAFSTEDSTSLQQRYPYYKKSRPRAFVGLVGQIGLSAGQETFVGVPRFGGFIDFGTQENRTAMGYDSFSGIGVHVGVQTSILVLFAGWLSYSATAGLSFGPITLDASLTRSIISSPESEIVARYNTLNPKIGGLIGPVWIQFGPSFAIDGQTENFNNWIRFKNIPMNIEVSYVIGFN